MIASHMQIIAFNQHIIKHNEVQKAVNKEQGKPYRKK